MTFDDLLADIPGLRGLGVQALRSWGYTADEAHQEALIALWKLSRRDIQPEHVQGYVITTLNNMAKDEAKRLQNRMEIVGLHSEPLTNKSFSLGWFFDLTGRLKHKQRRMLYQSYVQDYTHPELAEIYGLPVGTIKSKLHRICKRLEKINDY